MRGCKLVSEPSRINRDGSLGFESSLRMLTIPDNCKSCFNLPVQSADLDCAIAPIPLSVKEKPDAGKVCSGARHALCVGRGLLLWTSVLWAARMLPARRSLLRAVLSLSDAARMLRMRAVLWMRTDSIHDSLQQPLHRDVLSAMPQWADCHPWLSAAPRSRSAWTRLPSAPFARPSPGISSALIREV
jgi:hypothetical protein